MRKDVKIGLALGGFIFVVVISYVLFFTGPKDKPVAQANAAAAVQPRAERDAAPPEDPGPTTPAPSPDNNVSLTGPPAPPILVPSGNDTPPAPAPTLSSNDWARLLDGNPVTVSHSITPTPPPAPGPEIVAPPEPGSVISTPGSTPIIAPPAPPVASTARTHLVKAGENYWKIAEAEYGSGTMANLLIKANPKYPSNKLRAGISIVVPPKSPIASASTTSLRPTTRPVDTSTHYRVKPGDNLYKISTALYGKADRVDKLYDLNRDTIGPDPRALKPGIVLRLPEPPKAATPISGGVADVAH